MMETALTLVDVCLLAFNGEMRDEEAALMMETVSTLVDVSIGVY